MFGAGVPNLRLDVRTVSPHLRDFHIHNDASPGNVDLLWLRERTTSKRD